MKRALFLLLAFCASAFGVDSLTVDTAGGQLSKIDWTWTSDASGNASGVTTTVVPGVLYSVSTTPDTSAVPTDNYDVVIQNQVTGVDGSAVVISTDRAGGLLANRDQTNTELVEFWPQGVYTTQGKIKISVSNAGNAKSGRIVVTVHRNLAVTGFAGGVTVPIGSILGTILQWSTPGVSKWVSVSGDATVADGGALILSNTGVTPASYTSANITVDSKGRITAASDGGSGVGDVVGPASSTANAVALFDGTTGKLLKNSNITYSGTLLSVPADLAITGNNGLVQQSGTQEWYASTGLTAGNLRWRWVFDTDTESSSYVGSNLQLITYDNTGDGSQQTAMFWPRDPAAAWLFYHPITIDKLLTTKASATGSAGLNLPPGTAPSSPGAGDVWMTTAGMYYRTGGVTYGPLTGAGADPTGLYAGDTVSGDVTGTFEADGDTPLTIPTSVISTFGRTLVDDANASTARTTLGLGTMATQNASAVAITAGTISGVSTLSETNTGTTHIVSQRSDNGSAQRTGGIEFKGVNSTPAYVDYGGIWGRSDTLTAGAENGSLVLYTMKAGTLTLGTTIDSAGYMTVVGGIANNGSTILGDSTGDSVTIPGSTALSVNSLSIAKPTVAGTWKSRTPIWLSAAGAKPTTTSGADAPTVDANDNWYCEFDTGEYVYWNIFLPADFDGTVDSINVHWYADGSSSPSVTWSVAMVDFTDNTTNVNAAYGAESSASANTTFTDNLEQVEAISASSFFGTSSAAGHWVKVRCKCVSSGSFTIKPRLLGVAIEY